MSATIININQNNQVNPLGIYEIQLSGVSASKFAVSLIIKGESFNLKVLNWDESRQMLAVQIPAFVPYTDTTGATLSVKYNQGDSVPVNRNPVVSNQSLSVDQNQDLTITLGPLNDDDGDVLSYTVIGSDDFVKNGAENVIVFNSASVGTQILNVSASDGKGGTATAQINVTVNAVGAVNNPPTISDQNLTVKENVDLNITLGPLTDSDGDTLVYSVTGSSDISNGSQTNQIIFNSSTVGQQSLNVSVSDGNGGSATATITVDVTLASANSAPVVPDQTLSLSATKDHVIILGPATDADGDQVDYTVTGSSYFLTGPASNEITYNAPSPTTETLTVTGDDNNGGTHTGTINITVTDATVTIETEVAALGWSTMQTKLEGQNPENSTSPSAENDPSLMKLVGQMYAANGITGYTDDFKFLTQGGQYIDSSEATDHINQTSAKVAIISAYGASSGITMNAEDANKEPVADSNEGWIPRVVNIAQLAESRNITPIMYQCWGNASTPQNWPNAQTNTDNLQARHGMLVIRTAEIVQALGELNPDYVTNTQNPIGKYVPPVTHLYSGDPDNDNFHGSYAMQYMGALATFKVLSGISATDNAFVPPDFYGMSAQFISDIKSTVDAVQVESLVSGLAPGAAPIASDFSRNGTHDLASMINIAAASKIKDDEAIDGTKFVIKSITAAHFTSHSLSNGVFNFTPANTYTGDSTIVFTYTDTQDQSIDITLTMTIGAAPVIPEQEVIIGFGQGGWTSFASDGNLWGHGTTSGGKTYNGIRAFDGLSTLGDLRDADGVGVGSVTSLTSGNLSGPGFRANGDGDPDTYGPYPELYDGLSVAPKGSTVSFSVNGFEPGINYRVNIAGRYPSTGTNIVDVNINGVVGSYDCDDSNITEFEKVIKANDDGKLIITLSSDGTTNAANWGLSYVHINKITDGTAADTPQPPVFSVQPQDTSVTQGLSVTFSVQALAADHYQWKRNGVNVNGETSPTFTFITQAGDDGAVISVDAINTGGTTSSSNATLTLITTAPTITVQPVSTLTVTAGKTQTVSVTATGAQSYQWKLDGVDIAGATSATYTSVADINNDGKTLTVDVTNDFGTVTSNGCILTVNPKQPEYWLAVGRNDGKAQDLTSSFAGWIPDSNAEGGNGEDINFFGSFPHGTDVALPTNVIRNTDGDVTDLAIVYSSIGSNTDTIARWGAISSDAHSNQNVIDRLTAKDWYNHPNSYAWNIYLAENHAMQFEFSGGGLVAGENWIIQIVGLHYQDVARPVDITANGTNGVLTVGPWDSVDVFEQMVAVDGSGKITLTIAPQSNANISGIRLIKAGS